jgi:hypothetical protein
LAERRAKHTNVNLLRYFWEPSILDALTAFAVDAVPLARQFCSFRTFSVDQRDR